MNEAEIRADERERCAKLVEAMRDKWADGSDQWGRPCPARVSVRPSDCAAAIRALGTKHGVTMPLRVWERIKDGVPADYTEEEFRAYSAIQLARISRERGPATGPSVDLPDGSKT